MHEHNFNFKHYEDLDFSNARPLRHNLTTEDWFNQSMTNLERMSKDESYRQQISARATNWAKETPPQLQAELDKKAEQRANFSRQHKEFIKTLESL